MKDEAFDYELYEGYKEIAYSALRSVPCYYEGSFEDWATHQLNTLNEYADTDDFEACKAIKDAFIEYVNEFIPEKSDKIKIDSIINLEEL